MSLPDAALGAIVGELLRAIIDMGERTVMFKSVLEDIQITLDALSCLHEEIEQLNRKLEYSNDETKKLRNLLETGKSLVLKCGNVSWWNCNCFMSSHYTKKLRKWNDSVSDMLKILQVQQARDGKRILDAVLSMKREFGKEIKRNGALVISKKRGFIANCAVPELREEFVGFDEAVEDLKKKLLREEASMLPVVMVVTAPGGYGKTTLAIKFCHDKEVQGKFQDNIFFITMSRKPVLKLIVENVFQHKDYEVPEFQTDEIAVRYLEQLLKEISPSPILIVLDDVWLDSQSLVEKFCFHIPNFKILVTSRSTFRGFGHPYSLRSLSDMEAMKIFCSTASLQDSSSYSNLEEDIVEKIVGHCKRFPLALTVIGRSLRGKRLAVWKDLEKKLSSGHYFFHTNNELLNCLQSSLDVPDDDVLVKESFMDLGSFPEDQRIPASIFIDIYSALYELNENGAITILEKLSERNLVDLIMERNDAFMDDYYNEQYMKQHDVLRELAIHISGLDSIKHRKRLIIDIIGNELPQWWSEEKQHPTNARLISISTDDMFLSSWLDLQAPQAEVLILNLQTKNYNLPGFMKKMAKLKLLIVTNYGFTPTELSDCQLLCSLSNLKRIWLHRISFSSLYEAQTQLATLEKMSLHMCNLDRGIWNFPNPISNVFPNLLELSIDFCNDLVDLPSGICDMDHLKKLSITNCHKLSSLPEGMGKLVYLEVLRLRSCTKLIELPDSIPSLQNLIHLDISHCLSITKLPEHIGELRTLRKLQMEVCPSLEFEKLPLSFEKLGNLKEVTCDKEIAIHLKYFCPDIARVIREYKEDVNLNWLEL